MKVTVIPIIVGALGTLPKCLEKELAKMEIRRRIKTLQTTALLRLNSSECSNLRPEETCHHLDYRERTSWNWWEKLTSSEIIFQSKNGWITPSLSLSIYKYIYMHIEISFRIPIPMIYLKKHKNIQIWRLKYIGVHTRTHTHIYIYIYAYGFLATHIPN